MTPTTKLCVTLGAAALALGAVLMTLWTRDPSPPEIAAPTVDGTSEHAGAVSSSVPLPSAGRRERIEVPAPADQPTAAANAALAATAAGGDDQLTGHVLLYTTAPAVDATVRIGRVTTTTDAAGRFALSRRAIGDDDVLVATLPGYEPAVVAAIARTAACREGRDLEVVLPGLACGIDGWLVDRFGVPCPGWQIELFRGTACGELGFPNLLVEDLAAGATTAAAADRLPHGQLQSTNNPNLQTTGAGGVFRIGGLRRGHDYVLRAWNEHSLQTVFSGPVPAGTSSYVFTADLAACRERVFGRAVDRDGAPIAGVRVRLTMRVHQAAGTTSFETGQVVSTAADGSFEFHQVPQQDLLLRFDGKGIDGYSYELRAADPGTDLKVRLSCTCRFRYEASDGAVAATELRMLDGDDKPLRLIRQVGPGQSTSSSAAAIEHGRSPELEVTDAATWLELRTGTQVLGRMPVRLDRSGTNVVR